MVALIREYEVVYHFYLLSLGMVFVSQTTQNQIIMKKFIFLFFFFCFSTMMLAQNDVTIVGYIYDSETKQSLAYVNIGFVEKAVGTVSDEGGYFQLDYSSAKISLDDVLQISSIGYETKKLKASEFYAQLGKSNKIYLKPQPYNLDEVVIGNDKRKELTVGSSKTKENSMGYWLNKEALGGEIATKVNIKHKNTRLEDLRLQIVKNNSGSIKVRVNIYEEINGMPGENLVKANILHTISKSFGEEIIDLKPYKIVVDDNIIVSIELIKVFGSYVDFEVATSRYNGKAYTRHLSQDAWKRYDEELMAFSLKTSYPDKKSSDKDIDRVLPERITLYWDTSLSMQGRAIESELELLSDYLKKVKSTNVEVVTFSSKISETKVFPITRGKSDDLIEYLKNTHYDGATNYRDILKENVFDAQTIVVFTDGNTRFELLKQLVYVPAFYINTSSNANKLLLQKQANYGEGHYIDLLMTSKKEALDFMLNEIKDEVVYTEVNYKARSIITGIIKSDSLLIQGAKINVKNSYIQTVSDVNGNYSIEASEDDILQVSTLGMLPKEVLVSNQKNLDINLKPDGQLLEEVLLKAKARKEEILIDTPYGKKNADAVGYAVYEMPKEDIKPSTYTYDDVVAKLPGVLILGSGTERKYYFARNMEKKGAYPIIIVDDIIYDQGDGVDNLPPIDMQTVKSVQALKSVISTNRYGGQGAYGAIVIKTEATSFNSVKLENKPSALAQGNDYIESDIKVFGAHKEISKYVNQLNTAATFDEAKNIYYNQKKQMDVMSISYVLDASDYFTKWDKSFAQNTLTNIAEFAYNNPKALLTLAYKLEALKQYDEAKDIYQRIAELRPNEAQSYRNLALIYEKTEDYTEAMNLYKQMLSNSIEGVNFVGLEQVIANELSHLLAQHRSKVDVSDIPVDYLNAKFKYDKRIVFEWNEPNTEFELQFVNPKKKYFKWSHTLLDNPERMLDEVNKGYATEEYIIDDAETGEWIINIESLTEETNSINPTYLKYTVYKNYGLPSETYEVKVVKLRDCKPKVTFDTFLNQ
jgi:tetratricopeptide (TPR) repeat protein